MAAKSHVSHQFASVSTRINSVNRPGLAQKLKKRHKQCIGRITVSCKAVSASGSKQLPLTLSPVCASCIVSCLLMGCVSLWSCLSYPVLRRPE